jgi:4-amino-4-deoxy-L-arabinose transferase-like glycosyltransferase
MIASAAGPALVTSATSEWMGMSAVCEESAVPARPLDAWTLRGAPALAWLIVGLALILRVGWAFVVETGVRTEGLLDASFYYHSARHLSEGRGFLTMRGVPTAFFPPGYSLTLAGAFLLTGGPGYLVPSLVNALAGTLTVWITYALGARAYGVRVGLVAGAILATWPSHVYATSATMSDTLFTALMAAVVHQFYLLETSPESDRPLRWLALGALLGYASLVRGAALVFVGVLGVVLVFDRGLCRPAGVRAGLLVVALAAVILPWTLRNQATMGAPILLSSDGAWAFFNAHNERADGGQSFAIDRHRIETLGRHLVYERTIESEVELERLQMRYATRYMLTHPLDELRQVPLRIYAMHTSDDWPLRWIGRRTFHEAPKGREIDILSPGVDPWLGPIANAYYFAVLPLGLLGLAMSLAPSHRRAWIVPLTFLYFHALHGLLFFGMPRFHAPLLPQLALGAGIAIQGACARLRRSGTP